MTALPVPAGQTYQPTVERAKRTRDRVVIDGVDVTYFRGVECGISYELTEPYGYGPGSLSFPQISFIEEHLLGEPGELAPFRDGAHVRVDRVNADTNAVVVKGIYRGRIFTKRPTTSGLTVDLAGQFSGPLSVRWRPQPVVRFVRDIRDHIEGAFRSQGLKLKAGADTGVRIDNGSGGMYQLGWTDSCLALAYDGGDPWTVMPVLGRTHVAELRRKDLDTVHMTVWADGFGVDVDVVDDVTEKPNSGYGAGVSPDGSMWLNSVWPDLGPEQVPPFPGPLTIGDSGEGVFILKAELISDGKLNPDERGGGYTDAVAEAVKTVQEDADLPVTGDVDAATWDAVWGDDISNQRVESGNVRPLVLRPGVKRFLRTANGSIRGRNTKFDPEKLRVDRHIDFGAGVSKDRARRWWRNELVRVNEGVNYYGTITLDSDAWDGIHIHGEPGTIREKEQIQAGENIIVRKPGRDIKFHIASVKRDEGRVVLTVDTKGRDALHIGEMIARDQEARRDFSRNWQAVQKASRQTHDALTGWYAEDGAGVIRRKVTCPANTWTVFPVIGGQSGQVMRTTIETTSQPAAFVMAVAGVKFMAEALANRVPDPFALNEDDEPAWNDGEIQEWLHDEKNFYYVIGDATQPGGYWPKRHTNRKGETTAHPVTGVHKDWMTWPYTTFGKPLLWVAIYPDRDTEIEPQELFRGSRDLGA